MIPILAARAFLGQHWKLIGIGLLVLALAYQTLTKRTVIAQRDAAIERHASLELRFREASAHAIEIATKAKAMAEQRNKDLNNATDRQAADTVIVYRDRVLRLPAAANSGGSCPANLSGADVPKGSDGPGGDAVLLARADALICAANQGRLEAAHKWAVETLDGQ